MIPATGKPSGDNKPGTGDGSTGGSGGTGNADSSKPGAGSDSQAAGTVKTGDSANLMLWAALLGVSLAGYTLVVRRKKTDR